MRMLRYGNGEEVCLFGHAKSLCACEKETSDIWLCVCSTNRMLGAPADMSGQVSNAIPF